MEIPLEHNLATSTTLKLHSLNIHSASVTSGFNSRPNINCETLHVNFLHCERTLEGLRDQVIVSK